jgi:hypothetical protein
MNMSNLLNTMTLAHAAVIPRTTKFTLKRIVEDLPNIPSKGFNEETPKLSTEQKRRLQEMASMFENFGECIKNEEAIVNSAKGLTELCELAEQYAINECGDWFQQKIVEKDMKELKKRVGDYSKIAKEAYARMQQLGVEYQNIGHVLGRYYNLKPNMGMSTPTTAPQTGKQPLENISPMDEEIKKK